MSKIKNVWLDQYGAGLLEQQQFRTAGVEGVKVAANLLSRRRSSKIGSFRLVAWHNGQNAGLWPVN